MTAKSGDLAPETVIGRAVGVLTMVVGIVGAALATAILTERSVTSTSLLSSVNEHLS
jgi:uncharacterized membrane protein YeaQ/YmgE (transglycosylase-associated protein family)